MTITFPFIYFAPSIPPFLSQGGVRSGDALIFIIIIVIVMIYIYIYIYIIVKALTLFLPFIN